ncbi:MAG TPA: hypothetical protein VHC00_02240 [Rhizobiaceae bacterium]|nr:hypothetical protein [Rhizobiaceae bacterium]
MTGREQDKAARKIREDSGGQFAQTAKGRKNDGVASAAPEIITGSEDATFDTDPDGKPLGTAKKKPRR